MVGDAHVALVAEVDEIHTFPENANHFQGTVEDADSYKNLKQAPPSGRACIFMEFNSVSVDKPSVGSRFAKTVLSKSFNHDSSEKLSGSTYLYSLSVRCSNVR